MTLRSMPVTPELYDYLTAHSAPRDGVLDQLATETVAAFPEAAGMQIGPEQGTFMTLLTRLIGATRALEIGTFTGYSAICLARGLAAGGMLTCCDVSDEWTSVARKYWQLANVADRIDLQLRPALETLQALPATEAFDIAFIDADKGGYVDYLNKVLPLVRPGGLILAHNTDMVPDYVRAVTSNPDLETIFYTEGAGLGVTLKK